MINAYIVNAAYIKKWYAGYIDDNVDDESLNSFILLAQRINLQETIGFNMYNYIIETLYNDPSGDSFSNKYIYLLENHIQPAVSLWTLFQAYPSLLIKATNKSIVNKKSDESDSISRSQLDYIRQEIKNNAEFENSRIREYITNNPQDFNEYYTSEGVNRIKPKSNIYSGGLYLKKYPLSCGSNDGSRKLNF